MSGLPREYYLGKSVTFGGVEYRIDDDFEDYGTGIRYVTIDQKRGIGLRLVETRLGWDVTLMGVGMGLAISSAGRTLDGTIASVEKQALEFFSSLGVALNYDVEE